MLNPFPELLVYSFYAPLLIRIGIGAALIMLAYHHLGPHRKTLTATLADRFGSMGPFLAWKIGAVEIILALFLIAGFLTQIAAIVTVVFTYVMILLQRQAPNLALESVLFYLLLHIAALSLLFSGAGALAVDLPL